MTDDIKEEVSAKEKGAIKIDIRELYKFDPKDITPDISIVRYSNLAYIQVTHRDVYIDFLEMPGIKKDGKVLLNGTRIYMSFVAAQKLAETLQGILEQVYSRGEMEVYINKGEKEEKSSNTSINWRDSIGKQFSIKKKGFASPFKIEVLKAGLNSVLIKDLYTEKTEWLPIQDILEAEPL